MQRLIFTLLFAACFITGNAQKQNNMSPQTRQFMASSITDDGHLPAGYVYRQGADGRIYINALIKVAPGFKIEMLTPLGVIVSTQAGHVWSVKIPVGNVRDMSHINGIEYLQLDEPIHMNMDSVRCVTHTDSVHNGLDGLTKAFRGSGVIMGIIDGGFDYTHPSLYDSAGTQYRVHKVWEQTVSGTPPANFNYGDERSSATTIRAGEYDMNFSHGAHVAGIAAGSGRTDIPGNIRFRGIADKTDLVLVSITPEPGNWTTTGMSDVVDAISYIFSYAAEQGKPAVANLSWGCTIGPHDGLSLFSQACDALTGPGKIFVCSGGNNGTNNIHIGKAFSAADTLLRSFITFNPALTPAKTWIDVWGDTGRQFCLRLSLMNGSSYTDSTAFFCLDNQSRTLHLVGSDHDTLTAIITTSMADMNGKPRIFLDLISKTTDRVLLTVKGNEGSVNAWMGFVEATTGHYGSFAQNGFSWAVNGNSDMTVGDIASTRSAITVGAYNSKLRFTNIDGQTINFTQPGWQYGNMALFSSKGPTADGRTKPDITAPGMFVGSAISSYDTRFVTGGGDYDRIVHKWYDAGRNGDYAYAMLQGTSMSSPVVAGVIALMLEANPSLTPDAVRNILAETAIRDRFTGTLPPEGNNVWGHGKVNAMGAVLRSVEKSGIRPMPENMLSLELYPNPAKDHLSVSVTGAKTQAHATVRIDDLTGKMLQTQAITIQPGDSYHTIDVHQLPPGLYLVRLKRQDGPALAELLTIQ